MSCRALSSRFGVVSSIPPEFEIQSSENLQDWVAQPEKVTATVPLDAEKKFVRIALAQE